MTSRIRSDGFTLIEVIMVIMLVGILAVVAVDVISDTLNESRFEETVNKMTAIQNAIIGDSTLVESGARTSFGYLGDVGTLPTSAIGIGGLITKHASLASNSMNSTVRFAMGWNGPYLSGMNAATSFTTDSWGSTILYNPSVEPATLTSYGADGASGGTGLNQDIVMTMPIEKRTSDVNGFICTSGGPFSGAAQIELNYPDGTGSLRQDLVSVTVAEKGAFAFSDIPLGVRSISVYIPSKAAATTTLGPVVVTIDKPNYTIPCNKLDTNP